MRNAGKWLSVSILLVLTIPNPAMSDSGGLSKLVELSQDKQEKKILLLLDEMDRKQRRGMMNVPNRDGRLLRILSESIGAKRVVEIGTSNGFSGLWICLALRKTKGKLITFEYNAKRASLARQNFKQAGVQHLVELVEGDAHEKVATLQGPIDLVFIDADKTGYADYLKKLLPLVRPGGLIVAHNTNMRDKGIREYLDQAQGDPNLETIIINQNPAGVGVTLKKR